MFFYSIGIQAKSEPGIKLKSDDIHNLDYINMNDFRLYYWRYSHAKIKIVYENSDAVSKVRTGGWNRDLSM